MNEKQKKTALITGASSGIGNELSRLFAQDGYNLVLISRDKEKLLNLSEELEEKYNIYAKVIAKDLSKETSSQEIFDEVKEEEIEVNVLVNNTGSTVSNEAEVNYKKLEEKITSLNKLTRLVADKMMNNGGGKILNIALTDSKKESFALSHLWLKYSKALINEFENGKITVTTFYPGSDKEFFKLGNNYEKAILPDNETKKVEAAAKTGYKGLKSGKDLIISGVANKLLFMGLKLLPKKFTKKI